MLPIISVIIPCYNSGEYLPEAIKSVKEHQNSALIEIIIVDDGSTDQITIDLLDRLKHTECIKILNIRNSGPAAARNVGARAAQSTYLLFLDSDNKISPKYIDNSIEVFNANKSVGVVYGNPEFFGEVGGDFYFFPQKFDMNSILISNYIDTCAVIRKKVWEEIGGFDEDRNLTQEDWDFWIRVGKTKWKFYYTNEVMFYYRIRKNSHVSITHNDEEKRKLLKYIYSKHSDLFIDNYFTMASELAKIKHEKSRPVKTFIKKVLGINK
ncbi:MAG: glycosyltransferase family 2 protein [Janthinobacterium lividum]